MSNGGPSRSDGATKTVRGSIEGVMYALRNSPALRFAVPAFRLVAHLEAVSWIGLLTGMALEYGPFGREATGDVLVTLFGSVHGGLVIVFVALAALLTLRLRWRASTVAWAVAATVPPFATVAFDLWAARTGRYAPAREGLSSRP